MSRAEIRRQNRNTEESIGFSEVAHRAHLKRVKKVVAAKRHVHVSFEFMQKLDALVWQAAKELDLCLTIGQKVEFSDSLIRMISRAIQAKPPKRKKVLRKEAKKVLGRFLRMKRKKH
ncbi:MAG: hypothetical protein Q8P49_04520 [Candidatus Liptonbacteria bacterium]|nr:hypothetical protein [Candidatus Liptonbacteria bacterium]